MKFTKIIFIAILVSMSILASSQSEDIIIGKIFTEGNVKTKKSIILRELFFTEGDTITIADWQIIKEKSLNNLINTLLFHNASITFVNDSANTKDIKIQLVERWYFWPVPVLEIDERNFNVWWQNKSLSRASAGFFLRKQNFRGRMEEVQINVMAGYNQKLGFYYDAPYLNKKKTFGYGAELSWELKHEVNFEISKDKQVYLKQDIPVQKEMLIRMHFRYRPNYYIFHLLQFSFQKFNFSDSLVSIAPNYGDGKQVEFPFFAMYYKLKIDHRDFKVYPLQGYYVDLEIMKYGLGKMKNSNLNILYTKSNIRKYWQLSKNWHFAAGFIGKISNAASIPFLLQEGLGYGRDFVRGYEYYVVNGANYGVGKANIKWSLMPQKFVKVNFIKTEKFNTIPYSFYLNLFCDGGYVYNREINLSNKLPNTFLYSAGLGLDFITYYDKVARFEFTINAKGESGIFIHFIAPI